VGVMPNVKLDASPQGEVICRLITLSIPKLKSVLAVDVVALVSGLDDTIAYKRESTRISKAVASDATCKRPPPRIWYCSWG
jgi:hypothetical protein